MTLRRRNFIWLFLGSLFPLKMAGKVYQIPFKAPNLPSFTGEAKIIHVQKSQEIHLPKKPKLGECVHLIVDTGSVLNPGKLIYDNVPIFGGKEDIILDTISIVRLRYEGAWRGWRV